MLLRFGIVATIYRDRRSADQRPMPDGSGRAADSTTKRAQHELVISGDNVGAFAERIGFADTATRWYAGYRVPHLGRSSPPTLNRERFVAEIESVDEADGVETVYDVQIPGINAFDANGLYVHNCGEQPLPPYGACLLGSINLAALVS